MFLILRCKVNKGSKPPFYPVIVRMQLLTRNK